MDADAAAALAGGDGHTDEGHDNDGQGVDEALPELNLGGLDGAGTAHLLAVDVAYEFRGVHGLHARGEQVEVLGRDVEVDIGMVAEGEGLAAVAVDGAEGVASAAPEVGGGVEGDVVGLLAAHQTAFGINLLAAELVGLETYDVVALGVDLYALLGLEVEVGVVVGGFRLDILLLEGDEPPVGVGNDEIAEDEDGHGHDDSAIDIGPQHAPVAHTGTQDGHGLAVARHLRGEENDGDEDEQGTVEVDKARNEVEVVDGNDLPEGGVMLEEFVEFLAHVEGDDDNDDKGKCQKKGLQVLAQNVAIQALQMMPNIFWKAVRHSRTLVFTWMNSSMP